MKLEIGDKTYEFEFTINSVCDLEERTGKGFAELMSIEGLTSLRALIWCGLITHQKTLHGTSGRLWYRSNSKTTRLRT